MLKPLLKAVAKHGMGRVLEIYWLRLTMLFGEAFSKSIVKQGQ
jgi:hypothetical protein